jgi:peptidoglycan/xylan/chitin deacetylase (PgdA/CDA1 family)
MRKNKKIIYVLIGVLAIGGVFSYVSINSRNKAQAVLNEQVAVQAQKEAEEKKKSDEEKKMQEQKKLEEQNSILEQKKKEELAKQEQAIKGIGKSEKIPVLMYHSIDYEKGNELRIPKEKFREQMKYLKDSGFTPISLEELYSHMVLGAKLPVKPIVITFDDGYDDNYTNAYPVLKEFGFKAVVFMITSAMDTSQDYLSAQQIKEMDKDGVSVEGHTVNHPELDKLPYDEQVKELKESKASLEKVLGREVKYAAYPYGKFNTDTLKAVEELGYKMAFSTKSGLAQKSDGIYKLHRIYISDKYGMEKFKQLVNSN